MRNMGIMKKKEEKNSVKIKRGLELKIVTILTLVMIFFGGVTVELLYKYTTRYEVKKGEAQLETLVKVKGGMLNVYFQQMRATLNKLTRDVHLVDLVGKNSRKDYKQALYHFDLMNVRGMFLSVYALNKKGEVVISLDKRFEGKNYGFRDYFKEAMGGNEYLDVAVGVTSGQLGYYLSTPLRDDKGEIVGVVVGKLNPKFVKDMLMRKTKIDGVKELLVDRDGVVVESNDEGLFLHTLADISESEKKWLVEKKFPNVDLIPSGYASLAIALRNGVTAGYFRDHLSKGWYYRVVGLPGTGMHLVMMKNEAGILREAATNSKIVFWVVAIAVLATDLIVGLWLLKYMNQVDKLAVAAKRISEGKFDNDLSWESNDQLGELVEALREMQYRLKRWHQEMVKEVKNKTEKLKLQMKKLEEAKLDLEKFKLAVDNVGDHIVITDSEGIVLYANKAVEKITGFSPEEVVGKKVGTKELWGGLMGLKFYQKLWQTIKIDKKMFVGELTNRRRNGQKYIAAASIAPVLNKRGEIIYFVGVERDVTKAKEIDQMKTDFISLASHQLRTPLSAMRWFLEMLLSGDMGKLTKQQREVIKDIEESNDRMIELVNALLNISRIESGRIIVEPQWVNLKELVEGVVKDLEEYIKKKKQTVVVSVHPNLPKIRLDPKLVRQVYLNLISNAVKYTPEGGEINIFVSKKDKEVISQISDTGYGIPKEEQERIFERFFRASNVVKKEVGGTGLGLYLAKAVVKSSGGRIWFKSQEGKGTSFWFTLPLKGMKKKKGEVRLT